MTKVRALTNNFRYGGKAYQIGDEFEMGSRDANVFRALKKITLLQADLPVGAAMATTSPHPDAVHVKINPAQLQTLHDALDIKEGWPNEVQEVDIEVENSGSVEPEGQPPVEGVAPTDRPARGGRGARTKS